MVKSDNDKFRDKKEKEFMKLFDEQIKKSRGAWCIVSKDETIVSFCSFCMKGLVLGASSTVDKGKRQYHVECWELMKEGMKV